MWVCRKIEGEKERYQVGYLYLTVCYNCSVSALQALYEYDNIQEAEEKVHYLNGGN